MINERESNRLFRNINKTNKHYDSKRFPYNFENYFLFDKKREMLRLNIE